MIALAEAYNGSTWHVYRRQGLCQKIASYNVGSVKQCLLLFLPTYNVAVYIYSCMMCNCVYVYVYMCVYVFMCSYADASMCIIMYACSFLAQ